QTADTAVSRCHDRYERPDPGLAGTMTDRDPNPWSTMTETATRAGEPSHEGDASAADPSDGSATASETVAAPAGNAPVSAWSKGIAWARRNWLGLTIFAATWLVLLVW